ncbi:MAG: calcium-binding protein, partial [Gammaproteobacteria bacterium]
FGGYSEGAIALVIQADGKLIAAGFSNGGGPDDFDFALARYNPDGRLDTSFSGGGFRTFLGGGNSEGAEALAIQPDGKLVAAGFSNSGGDDDFALTRYILTDVTPPPPTDGTPPPPPRCGGRAVTILGTSDNDTIRGTEGPDVIHGLGGNDVIRGLGGDDTLCGGPGKDRLIGGQGRDRMFGQGGNDRLFGDKGKDRHDGGSGRDTCDRDRVELGKGCETTTRRGRPSDPPPRVPPPTRPIAGICNTPGCL